MPEQTNIDDGGALSIGGVFIDPPVVLAPMAGVTNPAFRRLCREQGAGLVVTEAALATGLIAGNERTWRLVDLQAGEHPIAVQLYACAPEPLAHAAALVAEAGADMVDLNMGCPMRKIVRSGYGAALLNDPVRIEKMFAAMSAAVDVPVTGKIRAGWEQSNVSEIVRAIENGGGAAVTIHGRTRSDFYGHHADLDLIAEAKRAVQIPVIGNGDVRDAESALKMVSATGCDAVMVGRGAYGNPWIFAELRAAFHGETHNADRGPDARTAMVLRHLDLYLDCFGERRTCLEFRKHALWYYRGTPAEPYIRKHLRSLTSEQTLRSLIQTARQHLTA